MQSQLLNKSEFNIEFLFDNYELLYDFLLFVKIYNFILKIENNFYQEDNFCSLIKINNELFNIKKNKFQYKFETLFESFPDYE